MIWENAADFWAMGGYAIYVWGSVGVSAALLVLEVLLARRGRQQALDAVCAVLQAQTDEVPVGAARRPSGDPS
jgi:heme exporter protein D